MKKPKQNLFRKSKKGPVCPHCDALADASEMFLYRTAEIVICGKCGQKYSAVQIVTTTYSTLACTK